MDIKFLKFKKQLIPLLGLVFSAITAFPQPADSVLIFSYFKGNGEDGLHLAYSWDGLKWNSLNNDQSVLKPTVAQDKLMRDPCITRGPDGQFHMVWTVSWNDKGIGYASSADLMNWSNQQFIPVMQHEPDALNCWAPELIYDLVNKQFMIYWSTTITGRFSATDGDGDEKYNHRIYYTLTNDFKRFTTPEILYDHGFNVIDASIYATQGGYTMVLKDETLKPSPQKNLRLARSEKLTGPYTAASAPITGKEWAEGPTMIFHDGYWWLYYDLYTSKRYACKRTRNWKNWEDVSAQLQFPTGARHGTVFKISAQEFKRLEQN